MAYVYRTFDPSDENSLFPPCPVYATSGIKCPGCGSQRAMHALLNGQLKRAWNYNPLFIFVLPYLFVAGLSEYANIHILGKSGSAFLTSRWVIWSFFIVIISFGLIRNIL